MAVVDLRVRARAMLMHVCSHVSAHVSCDVCLLMYRLLACRLTRVVSCAVSRLVSRVIHSGEAFSARRSHSMTFASPNSFWIYGGRGGDDELLSDLFVFDMHE